jgi:superfamily II DNA/RNA helicase
MFTENLIHNDRDAALPASTPCVPSGFDAIAMHAVLHRALADAGYTTPTDVQARAITPALAGRDLRVSSSTGSGKTASFVLPAL